MAFKWIRLRKRFRPAVIPGTVLDIVIPILFDEGIRRACNILILHIPNDDGRMCILLFNPRVNFRANGSFCTAVPAATKPCIFIRDQKTNLIGNVVPVARCRTEVEPKRIPICIFTFGIKRADPLFLPRMLRPVRIFKKSVNNNIGSP